MSDDALFQLGMDLDRGSSTAQTEEKLSRCRSSQEDERKDFFCERDGVRYAGTHLIIDLVRAERLDDLEHIEATLRRCVEGRALLLGTLQDRRLLRFGRAFVRGSICLEALVLVVAYVGGLLEQDVERLCRRCLSLLSQCRE